MKKFEDLVSILDRPKTWKGGGNDTRSQGLCDFALNDRSSVSINRVPWIKDGHLKGAWDDIIDAAWAMQDGRRDIRQLKTNPDIKE